MPFDGTSFQKTTTHPSLDGLIEWLETQDPSTTYSYMSNTNCLLCQYFRAVGLPLIPKEAGYGMGGEYWTDKNKNKHKLPDNIIYVPLNGRTYGEALQAAYKVRSQEATYAL